MEDDLYVLRADSTCGTRLLVGPFGIVEALTFTDQHLIPAGWYPKYLPLTPIPNALNVFAVGRDRRRAVLGQDLFVALRRAIITDQDNDGADCPRAAAIITHLEAHRPVPMYFGDEECRLAECDHAVVDGVCTGLTRGTPICITCSPVYDSGSEWGPDWIDGLRVDWPCQPIRAAAAHYQIEVPAHG